MAANYDDDAEDLYTIDDIADTIVEVSTDDDSTDDESDDELAEESKYSSSGSIDGSLGGENNMNSYGRTNSGSPNSENSMNSGSMKRNLSGSTSPKRVNSGKWRTSSVLSPAVSRISSEIFLEIFRLL